MEFERLADTQEIRKIESRFVNLISRTFLKGAVGVPASEIFNSVQKAFSSKTYELQLDKIIDDTVIASVNYADKKTEELGGSSSGSAQASRPAGLQISRAAAITPAAITPAAITPAAITPAVTQPAGEKTQLTAGKDKPLPITEEAIKQTKALSGDAAESVTRWLKDNDLYSQHPDQLARQVKDLWDGELYKARRFAVTFTADLAENTAIHRYSDLGITYLQFFAEIDDKTTRQCRAFHGTLIKSDSLDAQRYRPPLHHHCRSCLIPATSKTLKNEDLLIENRDFTQQLNQDFKPLPGRVDSDEITEVFKDINKFNDKYRIDQFILDEDLQLRLMKLNLNVYTEIPGKGKTTLDDFVKPEKVEPPKVEPEKPKYKTGQQIREEIPKAKIEHEAKIQKLTKKLDDLNLEKDRIDKAYEAQLKYMAEKYNGKIVDYSSPEWLADDKKLTDIGKAYSETSDKFSKIMKDRTKLMMNEKEAVRKLIYINDGEARKSLLKMDQKGPKGYSMDPAAGKKLRKQQAQETLDFYNKAVAKDLRDNLPPIQIVEQDFKFRPNADIMNAKINMAPGYGTDTLIHEVGHHLEWRNPEMYQSAQRMIARRTQGEEFEKLRDLTGSDFYKDNEITKKDKFFSPYIGKYYGENVGYSEAVSTSIAELYSDPEGLALKDPETFDWIVNAIRGIYE